MISVLYSSIPSRERPLVYYCRWGLGAGMVIFPLGHSLAFPESFQRRPPNKAIFPLNWVSAPGSPQQFDHRAYCRDARNRQALPFRPPIAGNTEQAPVIFSCRFAGIGWGLATFMSAIPRGARRKGRLGRRIGLYASAWMVCQCSAPATSEPDPDAIEIRGFPTVSAGNSTSSLVKLKV